MSSCIGLRFVRFEDPQAFLEAMKQCDESFMNFTLGSIYDYLSSPQYSAAADSSQSVPVYLLAIYRGDDLLITLTHTATDTFAWKLCIPSAAEPLLTGTSTTPDLLTPALALLASSALAQIASKPHVLDKIFGPAAAVTTFFAAWSALLAARGLRVLSTPGDFTSCVSYVSRASLTPSPPTPFPHPIVQATPDDLDAVAHIHVAFHKNLQANLPFHKAVSHSAAVAQMEQPIKAGLVWYARVENEMVGYVLLGRVTPRTIAIRNVFVLPSHRRRGIAEAMVRGVTRYYLNAPPYGVQPVQDGPPAVGFKDEVNLNGAHADAERVYKRCGFLFPDRNGDVVTGGFDPATGRKVRTHTLRTELSILVISPHVAEANGGWTGPSSEAQTEQFSGPE
ncbi:hypothetical protein C8T65DRAFT_693406 [Cerioporus squamosus]|nr:hypothetical protein C8T65DRAFT_693406 [Cerioporus squamosus]